MQEPHKTMAPLQGEAREPLLKGVSESAKGYNTVGDVDQSSRRESLNSSSSQQGEQMGKTDSSDKTQSATENVGSELTADDNASRLNALLSLAAKGWHLFPCHAIVLGFCSCSKGRECTSPGKHPMTYRGVKDATTDPGRIRTWHAIYPNANWALACGRESGVLVVDVDPRHGGYESLDKWTAEHELPETLTVLTGGGGLHFYFEYPADSVIGNRTGWLSGVDIKSDGGYVILPPSNHKSGGTYRWRSELDPSIAPPVLLQSIEKRERDNWTGGPVVGLLQGVPEGSRDNTFHSRAVKMLGALGVDEYDTVVHVLLEAARQSPGSHPFGEADIHRIVTSAKKHVTESGDYAQDWMFEWNPGSAIPADPADKLYRDRYEFHSVNEKAKEDVARHRRKAARGERRAVRLQSPDELRDLPKGEWTIDGVLHDKALGQVWGTTDQFKSFVMVDLCGSVANGIDWMGHTVLKPGLAAYILGEGEFDAVSRLDAWLAGHPECTDKLMRYYVPLDGNPIDVLDEEDTADLIADMLRFAQESGEEWRLVVFDTQADHLPGVNSDDETVMSDMKRAMKRIAEETGAAVLTVHHTGHDTSRERGHSRQRQMFDVSIRVHSHVITNVKQKAGPRFESINFRTVTPPTGHGIFVEKVPDNAGDQLGHRAQHKYPDVKATRAEVLAKLRGRPGEWLHISQIAEMFGGDSQAKEQSIRNMLSALVRQNEVRAAEIDGKRHWVAE